MTQLVLDSVVKKYGDIAAVKGVSLSLAEGEFLTLLGPSGCGKTTCLRMVAGFVQPDAGAIRIGGEDMTSRPPYRRDMGMVFQSYALFPHKTVAENIGFGLTFRKLSRGERDERVRDALALVQLEKFADRYPSQLSGGQKQRVALARAVVIRPKVLLLDEPLGALDLKLREELQLEIKRVQSTLGITTLFVTHDQGEALSMSDRIAVMRDGQVIQLDTPTAIYDRPSSVFAANFVGRTNLVPVRVIDRDARSVRLEAREGAPLIFEAAHAGRETFAVGETCLLAGRPEHFRPGHAERNCIPCRVVSVDYRGSSWNIELLGAGVWPLSMQLHSGAQIPKQGETIDVHWDAAHAFLLAEA